MIEFAEKLKESGILPRLRTRLGIQHLTAVSVAKLLPHGREAPGILIPYFDLQGARIPSHFRLRYLDTDTGFGHRKYDAPTGEPPRAYLAPILPWSAIAADVTQKLTITEGELKAICGCLHKIPTIGIGGVWSWKSAATGNTFLPDLRIFEWRDRIVELCFDSDVTAKAPVRRALIALARELAVRGARISMVLLPAIGEAKVGLDDYLITHGAAAYAALPRHPILLDEEDRRELFARWVVIRDEDSVYDLVEEAALPLNRFHAYFRELLVPDAEGKLKPATREWERYSERTKLPRYLFDPATTARVLPNRGLNLYQGLGVEPRRGAIEPWLQILDALVGPRPALRKWVLQWLAYPLQFPGAKLLSSVFIYSEQQGSGKSALALSVKDIYGAHGYEITGEAFFGAWNEWLERGLFVLVDDLAFDGHPKEHRSKFIAAHTAESATLSAKYRPRQQIQNRANFWFTANSPGALPLDASGGNRRVCVIRVHQHLGAEWFRTVFDPWRHKEGGPAHLAYYLSRVDLAGFSPRAPALETQEKMAAVAVSAPMLHSWIQDAIANTFAHTDLVTVRQLRELAIAERLEHCSAPAIGKALAAAGATHHPNIWAGSRVETFYAIRNQARWTRAKPEALAKHWLERFARGSLTPS